MTQNYRELFCLITFDDSGGMFIVPHKEIDDPEMAEVLIPYKREGITYGITCYITNLPNHHPAIGEMILLQSAAELVFRTIVSSKSNPGGKDSNGKD